MKQKRRNRHESFAVHFGRQNGFHGEQDWNLVSITMEQKVMERRGMLSKDQKVNLNIVWPRQLWSILSKFSCDDGKNQYDWT